MQKIHSLIRFCTIAILCLCSCDGFQNNNATTVSSDANVVSMTLLANDSFPSLSNTVFTIEDRLAADTGLIYNIDSIAFGTPIDSLIPQFTFNATPAAIVLYTAHDTVIFTGLDTVNFADKPCYLQVQATDLQTVKWYNIDVRVHTLDPDLFVWSRLADNIYPTAGAEQKLFLLNNRFVLLVNNGMQNSVYTSTTGKEWMMANSVSGLPNNASPRRMVQMGDKIYYGADNQLFETENSTNWTATDFSAEGIIFENLLFEFEGNLWAIVKHNETLKFATIKDYQLSIFNSQLPQDFPIADYAAVTFNSVTNRPRAMVVGGFAADGTILNTRWNLEHAPSGEYNWKDFSIEQPNFQSLTGVAVVWYNERFYMFGGVDNDNQIGEYTMLESFDEGLNWAVPDTTHNKLPLTFTGRQKASVVIGNDNAIYIVGGQTRTEVFSDAFRGKLNSIDWE